MDIARTLAKVAPSVRTSEAPVDKLAYARDLWPRHHMDVRAGRMLEASRPAAIAWPRTTEEVAAIVRACAEEGVPIVPFGAGSGVCGGVLPSPTMVVLDLKGMERWRRLDEHAPLLDVEAGAMGITLEERLQRRGFTVGHFPSSILCSTVGGWLAARGAGQCSGRYGKIEDMVAALEMVDGRGEIVTLRRRASGPDLTPLVIGSEGPLGVTTSATLRLHPDPETRAYSAFSFPSVEAGWTAMRAMFQAGLRPSVSRLYDPFDSFMAKQGSVKRPRVKDANEAAKKAHDEHGRPGAGAAALARILRMPRALNGVIDALGSRMLGGATLVLVFEGSGEAPHDDAARAAAIAHGLEGRPLGDGPARKWWLHRYSVSYRQAPVFRMGAFSDTMEVAAPWSRLGDLYASVRRALGTRVFVMAHLSHAYPDGCSIYFTFAGSAATDDEAITKYDAAWRDAMAACIAAGGTLSHHHGVGRSKAPRVPSELGAGVSLLRGVMRAFDPAGIFNPGALLPKEGEGTRDALAPPASPAGFAVDDVSLLATLPGGMSLALARDALARTGHVLPVTGEDELTVADWIATGMPGAPDAFSDPVDHVIAGLRATLRDGTTLALAPSPRRAVGPDLVSLFVGTGGKVGDVTSVDVRVRRVGDPDARVLPFELDRNPPADPAERALLDRVLDR